MQRRFMLKFAAALGAAALFASAHAQAETIKVGVTGGPHAQIMDVVKKVAKKKVAKKKVAKKKAAKK